jgi:hypothetical protein
MQINISVILSISLLLVPLVYVSSSIHNAYAAIRDPKYDLGDCSGSKGDTKGQTCCWYEKSYPGQFGRGDKVCQTCKSYHDSNGEPYEKCSDPKKQTIQLSPGANLQDLPQLQSTGNSTTPKYDSNSNIVK